MSPPSVNQLRKFVEHYTLCRAVHEVQIIWTKEEAPDNIKFKFAHTHSRVSFENRFYSENSYWIPSLRVATEGKSAYLLLRIFLHPPYSYSYSIAIMLLDSDILVSCDDVELTHSVWRSSVDSPVGYFPRLIRWSVRGWNGHNTYLATSCNGFRYILTTN